MWHCCASFKNAGFVRATQLYRAGSALHIPWQNNHVRIGPVTEAVLSAIVFVSMIADGAMGMAVAGAFGQGAWAARDGENAEDETSIILNAAKKEDEREMINQNMLLCSVAYDRRFRIAIPLTVAPVVERASTVPSLSRGRPRFYSSRLAAQSCMERQVSQYPWGTFKASTNLTIAISKR
jgi:hypothetical protein